MRRPQEQNDDGEEEDDGDAIPSLPGGGTVVGHFYGRNVNKYDECVISFFFPKRRVLD